MNQLGLNGVSGFVVNVAQLCFFSRRVVTFIGPSSVVETSTGCHDCGCNKLKSPKNLEEANSKKSTPKRVGRIFLVTL